MFLLGVAIQKFLITPVMEAESIPQNQVLLTVGIGLVPSTWPSSSSPRTTARSPSPTPQDDLPGHQDGRPDDLLSISYPFPAASGSRLLGAALSCSSGRPKGQ
jgi:hypothetical protein